MSGLVRHITPVPQEAAKGLVAEVYAQVNSEFSSIGPAVAMASPSGEIMAAAWSLMRESQLAGDASLANKALVAHAVAETNGCAYDAVSWVVMLKMLGEPETAAALEAGVLPRDPAQAGIVEWARAVARPGYTGTPSAPDPAAEYIGTALFTGFINRLATAMLPPDLLPGPLDDSQPPAFEGAPVFRTPRADLESGKSLKLLVELESGSPPVWDTAGATGAAYAALRANAAHGTGLLSAEAGRVVKEVIAEHHGCRPSAEEGDWLSPALTRLSTEADRAGAKVAILAGLAADRLTDADVAAWRATDRRFGDHCTVYLLCFGAMEAVGQLEAAIAAAHR